MKTRIQTLMDEWEQAKTTHNKAVTECEMATLKLDEQILALSLQIRAIGKEHEAGILEAEVAVQAAEIALKRDAVVAWESGSVFPTGKNRLPLDRGAWVQVSERDKREVIDPSAAVRFIVTECIEDTAIKRLTLDNDVVDAIMLLKREFPGVHVSKTTSVSISLPKAKKEAK